MGAESEQGGGIEQLVAELQQLQQQLEAAQANSDQATIDRLLPRYQQLQSQLVAMQG